MRRSAAPSQVQGNSFKKPKFIPPGRSNISLNKEITKMDPDIKPFQGAEQSENGPGVCSSELQPAEGSSRGMGHRALLPAGRIWRQWRIPPHPFTPCWQRKVTGANIERHSSSKRHSGAEALGALPV
ncbi:Rad54b [Phodopus roborovskii]|uniref:Rad54b protein n=1 Tax=Phodopus roborovskii TaxID=109678 RepID=A0AAU9YRS4_PHORO|nr:Rad54b [Phodopus roborovskii]